MPEAAGAMSVKSAEKPESIELPRDRAYSLIKLEVVRDIESELVQWAKSRFVVLTIVSAVIGFFGLNGLVSFTLFTFLKDDLREAQRASVIAAEAADKAKTATESATAAVDSIDERVKEIRATLDGLAKRIAAEGENSRQAALNEVSFIRERISKLEDLVASLSGDAAEVRASLEEFSRIRETAEANARQEFEENSAYFVSFGATKNQKSKAERMRKILAEKGFKVWQEVDPADGEGSTMAIVYGKNSKKKAEEIAGIVESVTGGPRLDVISADESGLSFRLSDENIHIELGREG